MDIRVIVFGMCFVLIALFIVANLYIPKAKEKSLKEANYSQAAQDFLKKQDQESYSLVVSAAEEYLKVLQTKMDVATFLEKERITFPKA